MAATARTFRPQAVPTVLVVILLPLFCGLGIWQLDRAEQKRQLAASLEARRKLPAYPLNQGLPEPSEREFRRVVAVGRFLAQKSVLIENRKHQGKRGFHVITPLQLESSGAIVLINRGWIPHDRLASGQPPPAPSEQVRLTGVLTLPEPPALELDYTSGVTDETPRWPFLTLDHFTRWSGLDILPIAVLQAPEEGEPDGFVRSWPLPQVSDAMHIGYAIQWFSFALIALLIWLRLSLHKAVKQEPSA